jgi:hypothetical protein
MTMKHLSIRNSMLIGTGAGLVAVASIVAACGGSSNNGGSSSSGGASSSGTSSGGNEDSGVTVNNNAPGSCASPTLSLSFSPMYSAYIANSTAQTFQIPAINDDGNPATWSSSDPSSVQLTADPTQPGAVMITVGGSNANAATTSPLVVQIFATESGGACGASTLSITLNSENDWQTGSARYNDGIQLELGPPAGFDASAFEPPEGGFVIPDGGFPEGGGGFHKPDGGGFQEQDGGSFYALDGGTACTSCHGAQSTSNVFTDVAHTPEQTGGFSDQDLINIFNNGVVPAGGYFDPSVILSKCGAGGTEQTCCNDGGAACTEAAYNEWHAFHQWQVPVEDQPGLVCYLRSLTPAPQNGTSDINFGGGGGHHRDGGGGPAPVTGDE